MLGDSFQNYNPKREACNVLIQEKSPTEAGDTKVKKDIYAKTSLALGGGVPAVLIHPVAESSVTIRAAELVDPRKRG